MKELLAVAYSRLKSYHDFYDLAAGTDTHGGTPDPSPGGDDAGCIAEGKLADLMIIDLERPNMQPINNITKNLVYSGSKDDVKMTMINGKILYENGEFVNIDKEEIYAKAQEICNRLKN